jgi:hypothetical protein
MILMAAAFVAQRAMKTDKICDIYFFASGRAAITPPPASTRARASALTLQAQATSERRVRDTTSKGECACILGDCTVLSAF